MADYCTLDQVREELIKQGSAVMDDVAINARIPRVTQLINDYCGHSFDSETVSNEIRTGEQVLLSPDAEMILSVKKGHIQSVSSASVSQDFKTWFPLDTSVMYLPPIGPIAYVAHFVQPDIPLVRGKRFYARISYVGGFARVPESLVGIACRWTAFLYMKRQAPFEVTAFPEIGQVSIPSAIPSDVVEALTPFVRCRP